jgi:hypothetical protein
MPWQLGWQDIVALIAVLGAGWYLLRRLKAVVPGQSESACGTCKGCGDDANQKILVEFVSPTTAQRDSMTDRRS